MWATCGTLTRGRAADGASSSGELQARVREAASAALTAGAELDTIAQAQTGQIRAPAKS